MSMYRVDPRVRAYGKARIDVTRRAKDEQEWQRLWKDPRYPFPFQFQWGNSWKNAFQYQVDDYAAEIGFLMDMLGLPAYAFSPTAATFTSPDQEFAFSVSATPEGSQSTPPDTLRIQFVVKDVFQVVEELERRGIKFEERPQSDSRPTSGIQTGCFRTPHGICIDLIGTAVMEETQPFDAAQWTGAETQENTLDGGDPRHATEIRQPLEVSLEEDPFAFLEDHTPEDQHSDEDRLDPFGFELPSEDETPGEDQESGPSQLLFNEFKPEDPEPDAAQDVSKLAGEAGQPGRHTENKPGSESSRKNEPLPRTNVPRRAGGLRGNGERRLRRAGDGLRKNPFNHLDLPPLPDFSIQRTASTRPDHPPRPAAEDRAQAAPRFGAQDQPSGEREPEPKAEAQNPREEDEEQVKYEDIEETENLDNIDDFFS